MDKKSIMIIDDTIENLNLLEFLLHSKDYEVRTFNNPFLAIKSIQKEKPDLILLDIMMPGMNGYEVCEELKKDSLLCDIPIIYLSAQGDYEGKLKAFSSGGVDYITKPFNAEELFARVETHLKISELQKELKKVNEELELKVEERTKTLQMEIEERKRVEAKLRKAMDAADCANKAKMQFMANMSHELRTPMNGIMGMADLLNLTTLDEEQRFYVESINISANNLLNIINDILDISKIESGKIELEMREFNLDDLINGVLSMFMYNAHKKNIEVVYYRDQGLPVYLLGDQGKLRQIIMNLISNAIKFTDKGNIFVEVKKISEEADIVEIEFNVTDTGIGMNEEIRKTVFEPFVQGDLSYTKKYQGTGLGLAIVKRLVDLMAGKIGFTTEENCGTHFYLTLNLRKSEKNIHNLEKIDFNFRNLTVLFIDDNELNRKITSNLLKEAGVTVYLAEDGHRGIELLKKDIKIDLILLDIHMPDFDGFSTAEKIKEVFGNKYMIIMFTSIDIRDQIEKMKSLGVSDYIMKPVRINELLDKIRETINMKYAEEIENDFNEIMKDKNRVKTIMVVEENNIKRMTLVKMLASIGNYRIIDARNGKEAVELYAKEKPDLIFMDFQMPVIEGIDVYNEFIKISEYEKKDINIIALTTLDKNDSCIKGLSNFLPKEYNLDELKNILNRYN